MTCVGILMIIFSNPTPKEIPTTTTVEVIQDSLVKENVKQLNKHKLK